MTETKKEDRKDPGFKDRLVLDETTFIKWREEYAMTLVRDALDLSGFSAEAVAASRERHERFKEELAFHLQEVKAGPEKSVAHPVITKEENI